MHSTKKQYSCRLLGTIHDTTDGTTYTNDDIVILYAIFSFQSEYKTIWFVKIYNRNTYNNALYHGTYLFAITNRVGSRTDKHGGGNSIDVERYSSAANSVEVQTIRLNIIDSQTMRQHLNLLPVLCRCLSYYQSMELPCFASNANKCWQIACLRMQFNPELCCHAPLSGSLRYDETRNALGTLTRCVCVCLCVFVTDIQI